jgi:hypothetical protein
MKDLLSTRLHFDGVTVLVIHLLFQAFCNSLSIDQSKQINLVSSKQKTGNNINNSYFLVHSSSLVSKVGSGSSGSFSETESGSSGS